MVIKKKIIEFEQELYFFILKKIKDKAHAKDILQNTILKVLENAHQLKNPDKLRAWMYQIARNELHNFYHQEAKYVEKFEFSVLSHNPNQSQSIEDFCCFNKFMEELPPLYKEVMHEVYIRGKNQKETAALLNLSLPNVKARIRRAKSMLKERFEACCQYELNTEKKLVGEPDCKRCHAVL